MNSRQRQVDNFLKNVIGIRLSGLKATVVKAKDQHKRHHFASEVCLTIRKDNGDVEEIVTWLQIYFFQDKVRRYVMHIRPEEQGGSYTLLDDDSTNPLLE